MKSLPGTAQHLQLDQAAVYRIHVQGRLDPHWTAWFGTMNLTVKVEEGYPVSKLVGQVRDQAALYGLLARIRDLGLPLLLVECVSKLIPERK